MEITASLVVALVRGFIIGTLVSKSGESLLPVIVGVVGGPTGGRIGQALRDAEVSAKHWRKLAAVIFG